MSVKECGGHGERRRKLFRRIIAGIIIFLLIVPIMILIVRAILRPNKPTFILQDTTVYAFNATTPNFLTSKFQLTVSSRNPNGRIGIYYDRLDVYAVYRDQQITLRTLIPPTYQGHKEINVWSPSITGISVPIAPEFSAGLQCEQAAGSVFLMIKMDGRVRWNGGTFNSGKYHIYVRCPAYITFGSRSNGVIVGENAIKYQFVTRCSVSVCMKEGGLRKKMTEKETPFISFVLNLFSPF